MLVFTLIMSNSETAEMVGIPDIYSKQIIVMYIFKTNEFNFMIT